MMNKPVNKIEQLIEEMCPQGVEFRALGEVGKVSMCKRIFKNQTSTTGQIPFYKIGTFGNTPNAFISQEIYDEYRKKFSFPKKGDVLLSASGTIGRRVIYDGEPAYFQDSNIIWIDNDESKVLNMFLYYLYSIITWQTEGGTIKRLYNDNLKKIQIPIPPLTIQKEIVKILDNFTQLEAELEAELEARKKQYEHYREELLSFGDDVEFRTLGEVCGYSESRVDADRLNAKTFIGVDNLLPNKAGKNDASYTPNTKRLTLYRIGDVLLGNIRPYLKKIWLADNEGGSSGDVLAIRISEENHTCLLPEFIYYLLSSDIFFAYDMQHAKGAKMPRGSKEAILNYQIPIPPLSKQKEIIAILDKFDALVNDISTGLPAEIAARKKQYEYYLNQLLSFKAKGTTDGHR